jgi:hypothetical protein
LRMNLSLMLSSPRVPEQTRLQFQITTLGPLNLLLVRSRKQILIIYISGWDRIAARQFRGKRGRPGRFDGTAAVKRRRGDPMVLTPSLAALVTARPYV